MANVLRDGQWVLLDPSKLVKGDIVAIKAGDKIPADVRVISLEGAKVSSADQLTMGSLD